MKSLLATLTLALLGLVSYARADEKTEDDAKFLQEAVSGGLLEIKLGELATERAANAEVKRFGERMVTDHTKANKDLFDLADKNGVKLNKTLTKKQQGTFDQLKALRGAEFDTAYMKHMVKDHEEDVAEFTRESKNAKSEQVRALTAKTLPTLQEHLRLARAFAPKVNALEKR
jgi:putative membrane protein